MNTLSTSHLATAYHEAGHVVMGYRYAVVPLYAEVLTEVIDDVHGVFQWQWPEGLREALMTGQDLPLDTYLGAEIQIHLAGAAAEMKFRQLPSKAGLPGGSGDWQAIERAYQHFMGHPPEPFTISYLLYEARQFFRGKQAWKAVENVAGVLVERGRVDGPELWEIIEATGLRSIAMPHRKAA